MAIADYSYNMALYEKYHSNRRLEKRVISDFDYTHRPLLSVLPYRNYKNKKILDIGCGTGTTCFYFASKGADVLGVDISRNAIRLAKVNSKYLGLSDKVRFSEVNFPDTKVKGKYDLVLCSETLEHIKDHEKALNEIYKLMSKKGFVLFSVPLGSSFLYRHGLLDRFDTEVGHLRRYNESNFIKTIENSKFKIVKLKKNQGILRDYLFTSTTRSSLVALANKFKTFSDILTFFDERLFFLGVSNMVVLAKKI